MISSKWACKIKKKFILINHDVPCSMTKELLEVMAFLESKNVTTRRLKLKYSIFFFSLWKLSL